MSIEGRISNHNSRAKRLYGSTDKITVKGWLEALARYGGRCANCDTDKDISIDHIIPLTKGGRNIDDNLQPLCKRCNSSKGKDTKVPPQFKTKYIIKGMRLYRVQLSYRRDVERLANLAANLGYFQTRGAGKSAGLGNISQLMQALAEDPQATAQRIVEVEE